MSDQQISLILFNLFLFGVITQYGMKQLMVVMAALYFINVMVYKYLM